VARDSFTQRRFVDILCYIVEVYFMENAKSDWVIFQAKNVVSVKGGCIEGLDWTTAVHIWTKSAMVPIPEGSESHSEDCGETEYRSTQEELDQPGSLSGSGGWPTDGEDKPASSC